ncbi:MAG: hypothetical protein ABIR83_03500 [Nakamurella sp.]
MTRGSSCPRPRREADDGRAVLEFIVLGVLVMLPVLYIAMSLLTVQATTFAAAQSARDAARLLDNAVSVSSGESVALAAARQTLTDQNLPDTDVRLHYVATGTDCGTAPRQRPDLTPGAVFDVCVTVPLVLPLLPADLTAANTVTGVFTLHVGEFRERR